MYLWVIIATFIAALFALNVSIRSDIKQLYVEPQAQTVVTKLYVQHRAAMNYISKRNRNSTAEGMSYRPGELTADMLEADLPYGFNQNSGFSKFTTWVYCLDKDKLDQTGAAALPESCTAGLPPSEEGESPDEGDGSNCCASPAATVYLVTYGCAPAKWRNVYSGKPDPMLLSAMKTTTGYAIGLGYAIDRNEMNNETSIYDEDLVTNMGIYEQGNRLFKPIPNYVSDTSVGNNSFANVCGTLRNENFDPDDPQSANNSDSCDYCLVYMTRF